MHDILAVADNYRIWGNSMRYAGELAAVLDGHLTGTFVVEPIMPISPSPLPVFAQDVYAVTAEVTHAAANAGPEFQKFIAQTGARQSQWMVAHGSFAAALGDAANWHDLLVVGAGEGSVWNSVAALGQLLLTCDLPCIVVPESLTKKAALDTIAIAWNGSSEAVRAMHAALPLLKRAKQVVMLVGAGKESFSAVSLSPPFSAEAHLRQHGIAFATKPFGASDADAGEMLLRAAKDNHADLLVMGAYGRTRFSEWVLGGATRHVLQNASLPILMRH